MVAPASKLPEREREGGGELVRERGVREREREEEEEDKVWRLAGPSSPEPSRVPALYFFLSPEPSRRI
jgi:hypothetical protein